MTAEPTPVSTVPVLMHTPQSRRVLLSKLSVLTIPFASCIQRRTENGNECTETLSSLMASIREIQKDWIETNNEGFVEDALYPHPIYDSESIRTEFQLPERTGESTTTNTSVPTTANTSPSSNTTTNQSTNHPPLSQLPDEQYPLHCEMKLQEDSVYDSLRYFICHPEVIASQYENWPLGTLTMSELELVLAFAMETLVSAIIAVPAVRKQRNDDGCASFYEQFHQHLDRIQIEIHDHANTTVTATIPPGKVTEFFTAIESRNEDDRTAIYRDIREYIQPQIQLPTDPDCPDIQITESGRVITIEQIPGDDIAYPDPDNGGPPDIGPSETNESENASALKESLAQTAWTHLLATASSITTQEQSRPIR